MAMNATGAVAADLAEFLRDTVADLLGLAPDAVPTTVALRDLGVDSSGVTRLAGALTQRLGTAVPAWLLWRHPTVTELAAVLAGERDPDSPPRPGAGATTVTTGEPIALVGLGCRLPGGVTTPHALWDALMAGTDAVTEVPPDRWDAAEWFDEDPQSPGKMSTRRGGFIDDVGDFDAAFFGISPAEAARMDPQQRIALEVAWAALEDARIVPDTLAGSQAGVFFGTMWQEYQLATGAGPASIGSQSAVGWDTSIVPARVAYALGLEGPALSVGSACSSSLAAVHLAAHSLRRGECDLALAGGVSLMLHPHTTVAMTKFGGMNPDGQCRAFDADAAGYVRGEGCGVVVLRRLSDALRDGDRIYAVLRGSATNNDGASNGLTAPNPRAQANVVGAAWREAGIAPHHVAYVEAHGTGTPLGDPIEAAALGEVFAPGRTTPLLIGSAKTNFGHLEPAAGILGVLKTALALHHGELPASLHFERPNAQIDFTGLRLEVVAKARDWPDGPRHAGVSGFGFGGTNVHVALTEAPHRRALTAPVGREEQPGAAPPVAFCFSGHGSQWVGMGRDLLAEPVFRRRFAEADQAVAAVTGWSVLDELVAPDSRLERTEVLQPVLFALQVSLADTLRRWGVVPDVVFGQSVGEVAAAVVAEALTLEQGARVIGVWSQLVAERASGTGSMLVCEMTSTQAALLVGDRVTIAGHLTPEQTCLSGPTAALAEIERELEGAGVRTYRVDIDYPSHSAELAPLRDELIARVGALSPAATSVPLISTVSGDHVDGATLDARYWADNMCQPMLLDEAVRRLAATYGQRLHVVEVAPHPVVSTPIARVLAGVDGDERPDTRVLATCRRDRPAVETLEELLRTLRSSGLEVAGEDSSETAPSPGRAYPWVLSAKTPAALRAQASALHDHVRDHPELSLVDVGHSLATTRSTFRHRAVVVADDRGGFLRGLAALAGGHCVPGVVTGEEGEQGEAGRSGAVLVFPGQGAQWTGMARELLTHSPAFAQAYAACARALAEFVDWSPTEALADEDALRRVDVVQPVLWAVMVSLAELWRAHGVRPAAVIGHSQGEIAAACVAGGLSLRDGARVVALRSQAISRSLAGHGGMVSVALARTEVERLITRWEGRLAVAVVNGPGLTVVAGAPDALDELTEDCVAKGVRARRVPVDYASHTAQVDALREELLTVLTPLRPRSTDTLFLSTVTGDSLDTAGLDAEYWFRNLRGTVEFESAVASLDARGHHLFVEVSPHPVLTLAVEETVGTAGLTVLGTLRRDTDSVARFLCSAAEAWVRGLDIDWRASFGTPDGEDLAGPRTVDLPTYTFQHKRYWLDPVQEAPAAGAPTSGGRDADFWSAVDRGDIEALTTSLSIDAAAGLDELVPALSRWRRRAHGEALVGDWRYEITWKAIATPAGPSPTAPWLVLLPSGGTRAADVSRGLSDADTDVVPLVLGAVEDRELTAKTLRATAEDHHARSGQQFAGVLSLLALEEGHDPQRGTVQDGYLATLRAVQALGDAGVTAPLWVATREAVRTGPEDQAVDPAQRMIWGLGRVVALEHSDRWGGLIDLPAEPDPTCWRQLAALLGGEGTEDQLAVRTDHVWARRLIRSEARSRHEWRPSGTVLVTGGTGALGRRLAHWLATQGVTRLVLTSRRGPDAPDAGPLVDELRALGTEVVLEACDVADRTQLHAVLDRATREGPLTAVLHAAAVLDDAMVDDLTPTQVERVMRVKAQGAWNLHELTREHELSAFVLFSSYGATVGIPGQGNYAPANAFLDGLAELRHLQGLPATAVSWGAWGGGGLARGAVRGVLERHGVPEMDPDLALIALREAVESELPCQTVADVRWPRFLTAFTAGRPSPLLADLPDVAELTRTSAAPMGGDRPAEPDLRQRLEQLPAGQRLDAVLDLVRTHTGAVLGYEPGETLEAGSSFKELGFDSVTGVELRNRLNGQVGLRLPATLVFEHPTPTALATHVLAELGIGAEESDGAHINSLERAIGTLDARTLSLADTERLSTVARALQELLAHTPHEETPREDAREAERELDEVSDDELFQFIDEKFGL